jgi:hypothetical protein
VKAQDNDQPLTDLLASEIVRMFATSRRSA